ncbi:type IV secretory system conjugative DNA transfer family protein [Rubellimicrobium aerolatum]|uniref:Type IV secretory system conjugative DNA transfer family protein n=1 Tax=Rubellimicrobium aerolatum TaxID=490979 RepID=A0ABW0SHT3_9RHOB|nr:type IV secretion system protein VirD4 [Rubellimicrobium aerolatum]
MVAVASALRALTRWGTLLIAAPVLAVWLLVYLAIAVVVGTVLGMILIELLGGSAFQAAWWHDPLLVALAGLACLVAANAWSLRTGVPLPWHARPGADSHGSARFATKKERRALQDEAASSGLLIGRDAETGRLLRYSGPAHLLTLAPTRSGKGVGTVIPNLLVAERSVLCIDPKGENARIAGEARRRFGPVHVLDPFGVTGLPSASYNPLGRLPPFSPDLGEDAASLAEALVVDAPGQTGEAHWNEEAKALLSGLILFAVCHEDEDRRTLASVREYLTLPPERFRELLGLMQASEEADGLVARAANRFLGKSDREASGVLSSAQRHTHFLDSPRIVASTARSDFSFASLRHEVASVFLVLPPNRLDAYSRWLRLLVSQALAEIARDAEAHGVSVGTLSANGAAAGAAALPHLPTPALFLLDEFAALGRLEAVERAMGLMAGYGLQLWPILQDMSQLRALYGARASTFVANAGVLQAFGVNDHETAKWLSQLMGQETTAYETQSHRPGDPPSTSLHLTGRDLLTPDEVMRLPAHLQLLRVQGQPMILAQKLRYFADPEFGGLHAAPQGQ